MIDWVWVQVDEPNDEDEDAPVQSRNQLVRSVHSFGHKNRTNRTAGSLFNGFGFAHLRDLGEESLYANGWFSSQAFGFVYDASLREPKLC